VHRLVSTNTVVFYTYLKTKIRVYVDGSKSMMLVEEAENAKVEDLQEEIEP
jgi:hypothetical protein